MKSKAIKLLILVGALLCLSGCVFRGTEHLFVLPKSSELYLNLQSKIESVKGGAEYISPLGGGNTQSIQLVDLNGDGIPEAVAFFRKTSDERPLKIAIFQQDEKSEYQLLTKIEGLGTDIKAIEYCDVAGDGVLEVLATWQVTPTVHTLATYDVSESQGVMLMQSGCTRYITADLNRDGKHEIYLVQIGIGEESATRVEMYMDKDGALEQHAAAPLSEGVLSVVVCEVGVLKNGEPALMITCEYGENFRITDIFAAEENGIKNITFDEATRRSESALRHYTSIAPADIDGDGVTEFPLTRQIPSHPAAGQTESFWQIIWTDFDLQGASTQKLATYHNNTDRWYLVLPSGWDGNITLSRQEYTAIGERALVFSYWQGDPNIEPQPFLTIYRLTENNRHIHAEQDNRFLLWSDSETVYAAEFVDCNWSCGLTEETLKELFHAL